MKAVPRLSSVQPVRLRNPRDLHGSRGRTAAANCPLAFLLHVIFSRHEARTESIRRVLRGGSFGALASSVRSALRNNYLPTNRDLDSGFRLARTLQSGSLAAVPPTAEGGRK